jgi:hypothetical protein
VKHSFHFSFLIFTQSVGLVGGEINPSQVLNIGKHKHRISVHTKQPFEPTITVSERAKTLHTLHCSANNKLDISNLGSTSGNCILLIINMHNIETSTQTRFCSCTQIAGSSDEDIQELNEVYLLVAYAVLHSNICSSYLTL